MHGLLLVDKPAGISSAAVVAKIKRKFGFKKVGHGGTLDPFASGLLVLLVGDGTKVARFLLEGDKTYEAEADLRFETDTGDNTGAPLSAPNDFPGDIAPFQTELPNFLGTILQRPPMYSAIKRDGKPLYAYAREGKTVDVPEREVSIHSLEIQSLENEKIRFRVTCSGGTYIRVLAADWARAAGAQAHLSGLRRTRSNNFTIENAQTLNALLTLDAPPPLISIAEALAHLPTIACDGDLSRMLRNGHPKALTQLNPIWPGKAPYAIALESADKTALVAILSKPHESAPPSIERVFDQGSREA